MQRIAAHQAGTLGDSERHNEQARGSDSRKFLGMTTLWQRGQSLLPGTGDIGRIDPAAGVNVIPEIGSSNRLECLLPD